MKIVYAYSGCDFGLIKKLGFDTVLGRFSQGEMDIIAALGLKCIYSVTDSWIAEVHPAIIAYYLYDEPDLWNIPIADQEKVIAEYRAFTKLPLCIAIKEATTVKCSLNFDWYMLDIYYSNKYSKLINYLNIAVSTNFIKTLYKGKKIMPIMGLYDDFGPYVFTEEILPFARKFRSYFDGPDYAIFIWNYPYTPEDKTGGKGIADRPNPYYPWAVILNSTTDNSSGIVDGILSGISWLVLKINPFLGRWKIQF